MRALQNAPSQASSAEPARAPRAVESAAAGKTPEHGIGPTLGALLGRSSSGQRLPSRAALALRSLPGHTLDRIRIHDDPAAHTAARALDARAFTIGSSIYFGRGEYRPRTRTGFQVLAHEAAHAHQQASAEIPPAEKLAVAPSDSREELEADRFAAVIGRGELAPLPRPASGAVARVMRLTFDTAPATPAAVPITDRIIKANAGPFPGDRQSFTLGYGGGEETRVGDVVYEREPFLFEWGGSVTIHGEPGENFGEWEAGMPQVLEKYSFSIDWKGSDPKHCGGEFANLRDTRDESIWFSKAWVEKPFTADGDTRTVKLLDTPTLPNLPYKHPDSKGTEAKGSFKLNASFVAFICAHRRTEPEVLENLVPLKSVRWGIQLSGSFDGTDPGNPTLDCKGSTPVSSVIDAAAEPVKPIIGGTSGWTAINTMAPCWDPTQRPKTGN